MAMDDFQKQDLLSKVQTFRDTGQAALESTQDKRKESEDLWNGVFGEADGPKDRLYYPVIRDRLRHYIRALRKTYMSAPDIVEVSPFSRFPSEAEVKVADLQREEMNYNLLSWNNMLDFIDDTALQGLKYGVMFGKVWWEQLTETRTESVEFPTQTTDPETNLITNGTESREIDRDFIIKNKLHIDYIPIEDILYDTRALFWDDVKWVIHQNIQKTETELWDHVSNDGWNEEAVFEMLNRDKKDTTSDTEELQSYFISEVWGEIALPEDNPDRVGVEHKMVTKFVKLIIDNDFMHILKDPDENVYTDIWGEPMMPFEAWNFVRKEGRIVGESWCQMLRDYQGEINTIRNQRRRSVENDLTERYAMDSNSDVDFHHFPEMEDQTVIRVSDLTNGFKEITHKDNTVSSYNELEVVDRDLDRATGVNQYALGMVDAHTTDTLGGIQLMSNASNNLIFDNILSYNQGFERLMTKGLHMSLQFKTPQELEFAGIDVGSVGRENMFQRFKLRLDAGQGATSEQVKLNNKMKAYFTMQQWLNHCYQNGIEPGVGRFIPTDILRSMLPFLQEKGAASSLPTAEELEENTRAMLKVREDAEAEQAQAQAGEQAAAEEVAGNAGRIDAAAQQQGQGDQGGFGV